VPWQARGALGVQPGDKLLVVVRGDTVVILPRPNSWTKALRGLAKEPSHKGYLDSERNSWH
jgi:bifunctional DNA-binding transcriptional regulator/antitoxin component of YhaV-PrlF toxin-antitoxin module